MLGNRGIPQYDDKPESWARFLDKAAQGSAEACEILAQADLAYMVALTGHPTSPAHLDLDVYAEMFRRHRASIARPATAEELALCIQSQRWFTVRLQTPVVRRRPHEAYRGLWARRTQVSIDELVIDSIVHCHANWSADWLLHGVNTGGDLNYNSASIVAAMFLLATTWK